MDKFFIFLWITILGTMARGQMEERLDTPTFSSPTHEFTLLGDSPLLQVFDFPDDVPILETGCILTPDSLSKLPTDSNQEVYFGGCRNKEYCEQLGLSGSKKWVCSSAGAGQTSKCFQCK